MNLKLNLSQGVQRGLLVAKKISPDVLSYGGIAMTIGGGVLACRATLKAQDIINARMQTIEVINQIWKEQQPDFKGPKHNLPKNDEGEPIPYTEKDFLQDKTKFITRMVLELGKVYLPAILVGGIGIAAILGGHDILKNRNAALMAAYTAVDKAFSTYRQRVKDEVGEEREADIRHAIHEEVVTSVKPDGTEGLISGPVIDPNGISEYARFFDESSSQWSREPEYNMAYLKCQQNYANDLLKSRGHIFLNEVYDMIGVPRSKAGTIVGWVISKDGDNFVDFGIYDPTNLAAREFVNGQERSILLDFNVDGVIYDRI